ncbi:MAG: glucans biosynthesis glucosyltransferase MdoH [Hyphomicrobium sp.]
MTRTMGVPTDSFDSPLPGIDAPSLSSPAGLQANATLNGRRAVVLAINLLTWGLLLFWMASILATGGWTAADWVIFTCFVIGLWQLSRGRAGLADVAPFLAAADGLAPLATRTAVLMTLRNEDPSRALLRLKTVKTSLDATGEGSAFSYFILSDTDRADVAAAEERLVDTWRAVDADRNRIVYRRRTDNTGFKAGNVRDFCERWGADYELMLPLDADSLMTGGAIRALVRIMQAHPKIGILQSLVVGMPSRSAFARIFQFGMRHGMRAYTMGQAWWVGECGPYWGHNAVVRIKPFAGNCDLPILPGRPPLGGHVMSHDQVEATLMRRAGFEVRVMPVEGGSYEENPPDALAFIGRDVRWCQGNMQYLKLLGLPGLKPVSRFQLVWAILMFVGIPAWTLMIALLPVAAIEAQGLADFPVASAKSLYVVFLLMYLSPKLAGLVDAVTTKGEVQRFGGGLRFGLSAAIEIVFSFLQGAVTTIRTSLFMIGLLFGKSIVWSGQKRDGDGVTWTAAVAALWPQLFFGLAVCGALYLISPTVLVWSLPLTAGYLLAIPFTVLTANPALGRFMQRHGLAGIPEDFAPPPEIASIQAPEAG